MSNTYNIKLLIDNECKLTCIKRFFDGVGEDNTGSKYRISSYTEDNISIECLDPELYKDIGVWIIYIQYSDLEEHFNYRELIRSFKLNQLID